MVQKTSKMWKRISALWKSFTQWMTPVLGIGSTMVIISVALIASQSNLLQAAGTALLAAGLTIITTTLTGREAARQQFAKETNTLRKDTIYGPLFIELKQIYTLLEKAQRKEGPYPLYIWRADEESESRSSQFPNEYPAFVVWSRFREDYRIGGFKIDTRNTLDEIQKLILAYDKLIQGAFEQSANILALCIRNASAKWMGYADFEQWNKALAREAKELEMKMLEDLSRDSDRRSRRSWDAEKDQEAQQAVNTQPIDPFQSWNNYLRVSDKNEIAELWLAVYDVLGWIIVGMSNEAALSINNGYCTREAMSRIPDISWFQGIMNEAWFELDNLQEVKEVREKAKELYISVKEAKRRLEDGIKFIQDQYEGGEPLV